MPSTIRAVWRYARLDGGHFDLLREALEATPGDPSEGIRWELSVEGSLPGIDFHAVFGLPIFAEDTVAQLIG